MNINNLEIGMVIKNYRDLCKVLDWEITGGNTKKKQLRILRELCKYEKRGNAFVIKEIYNVKNVCLDMRGKAIGIDSNSWKEYEQLKISYEERESIGIYYILKDNDIYIGSTTWGFRNRFLQHYHGYDELMKHTYDLLQNGGEFHILYDMTGIEDEPLIRRVEDEYIQYFKNTTNYNVVNKKENAWSVTEKKKNKVMKPKQNKKIKYKTLKVKIKEDKYEQALELLRSNGLLDLEENETPTNNYILNGIIKNDFDINNMPF